MKNYSLVLILLALPLILTVATPVEASYNHSADSDEHEVHEPKIHEDKQEVKKEGEHKDSEEKEEYSHKDGNKKYIAFAKKPENNEEKDHENKDEHQEKDCGKKEDNQSFSASKKEQPKKEEAKTKVGGTVTPIAAATSAPTVILASTPQVIGTSKTILTQLPKTGPEMSNLLLLGFLPLGLSLLKFSKSSK